MQAIMNAHALRRLVTATKEFCAAGSSGRPANEYIRLGFHKNECCVEAAAVDGYTLATEWELCQDVDEDFAMLIRPVLPPISRRSDELAELRWYPSCISRIKVGDMTMEYATPELVGFLDYQKVIPQGKTEFRIGVNGEYLMRGLKAASTKQPLGRNIELRFYGELKPIVINTETFGCAGKTNTKLILPKRLRREEDE